MNEIEENNKSDENDIENEGENMSIELIIAFIAILISFFSVLIGALSLHYNRVHNIKSVKPICNIFALDYENFLAVQIKNVGIGPLIIKSIEVINDKGQKKKNLIDWMPKNINWSYFEKHLEDSSISSSEKIILLEYDLDLNDKNSIIIRDKIRRKLMNLRVKVNYTDIYETEFEPEERSLTWFGRTLTTGITDSTSECKKMRKNGHS